MNGSLDMIFFIKRTKFLFGDSATYKFIDKDFEAFSKSAYVPLWFSQFE